MTDTDDTPRPLDTITPVRGGPSVLDWLRGATLPDDDTDPDDEETETC